MAIRRYRSSLRVGKNWPRRKPGVCKGRLPDGTACVFISSGSYKLVVMIFLTEGFVHTTRAILNTGSGYTLMSRQLLPDDTQLLPLGALASMFHDANGG